MASSKLCLLLFAAAFIVTLEAKPTKDANSIVPIPELEFDLTSLPDDEEDSDLLGEEDDEDEDDGYDEEDDDEEDGSFPVRTLPYPKDLFDKLGINGSIDLAKKEINITLPKSPLKKQDIIEQLIAKSKPNVIKNLRDGSLSRFIKLLVKDCIKDIIRTINRETKPAPVVKDDVEKAQEKVNKLKEKFNEKIEKVYAPLFECLKNSNNPKVDKEDIKEKVQELIEDAKLKVESLVEFYTGTSKTFVVQLKSEKELINEHIKNFTDAVVFSKCVSVRQSKKAFQRCVEPIYCEFTANLTNSIDKVEELTKAINLLTEEAVDYVQKEIIKIINNAKEKVVKECENVNTTNPDGNAEYLKNKSENALKEVEDVLKGANDSKNDLNNLIKLVEALPADVNATQAGLREIIKQYLNNTGPPNAEVNKYVEEKQKYIDELAKKVVDEVNNRQKEIQNVENKIESLKKEYTSEKVNEKCKGNAQFTSCVDSAYQELKDKLQPLVEELKNLNKDPAEKILEDLKNKTENVLKEATEQANKESQRIIDEALEKIKYVKDTKEKSDEKIKSEVDPLVNETSSIVKEISSNYDKVVEDLKEKLISTVSQNADDPNAPLTPEDQKLVNDLLEEINKKVEEYKNQLKEEEAKVKNLEKDLKNKAAETDQQYLKDQCSNEWDFVKPYKSCIDKNIAPLNEKTDNVVKDVNEIIEKLKQKNVTTDLELKNLIKDIIDRANETTIINRNARDENNETTSSQRILECLESINKIISEELTPLIENLYIIPQELKNESSSQAKAASAAITSAYQTWLDALDLAGAANPKHSATYNNQKPSIKTLLEASLAKINSNIKLNLDSFISFELKLQELQESLYKNVSAFNAEKLNKTCEPFYSSKTNYSKCIDQECSKFKKYIDETAKELDNASDEVNLLYLDTKNNITATIEEEEKKAFEKAKEEAQKLFEENKINDEKVLELALEELKRFNITPYNLMVNDIRNRAIELNRRNVQMNATGNNMLNRATLTLNLHTYAASQMCPKISIKQETDYAQSLIEKARNAVYPKFPNATLYANDQIALANKLQEDLLAQINLLKPDNINKFCGSLKNDLYSYFACIKGRMRVFENYFVPANNEAKVLQQEALYGLQNKTILLNQWRDEDVTNELNYLRQTIGPIPERIYSGPCNATKDKAVDFALLTINNRWNRYNKSIPEAEKAVVASADAVLGRNYTGIVNIESKLNDSVKFIRDAIVAVDKVNATYITPTIRAEPDRNIAIGVARFNNFINEIYNNATKAINDSKAAREQSEVLYKSMTRSAVEENCWRPNIPEPISSAIVCINNFSYNFEVELQKLQTKLEDAKKLLDRVNDSAGKNILEDYANKLAKDLKEYSAQYAIALYQANKLAIPSELLPYVKTNCIVTVESGNKSGCLIEF